MILFLPFNHQFLLEDINGEVLKIARKKIQKYGKFWLTQLISIQVSLFQMDCKLSQELMIRLWIQRESRLGHIESINLNGLQLLFLEFLKIGEIKKYTFCSFKF
jgi:hypothetical protein